MKQTGKKENGMIGQTTDVRRALVEQLADEYGWLVEYPEAQTSRWAAIVLVELGGRLGFDKDELRRDAKELALRNR